MAVDAVAIRQYYPRVPDHSNKGKNMSKRIALIALSITVILISGTRLLFAQSSQHGTREFTQLKFRYIGPPGNRTIAVLAFRAIPTFTTWARLRGESSKPLTADFIGNQSSIRSRFLLWELLRSRQAMQISFGRARASLTFEAIFLLATESINPPTQASPGPTWAWKTRAESQTSS